MWRRIIRSKLVGRRAEVIITGVNESLYQLRRASVGSFAQLGAFFGVCFRLSAVPSLYLCGSPDYLENPKKYIPGTKMACAYIISRRHPSRLRTCGRWPSPLPSPSSPPLASTAALHARHPFRDASLCQLSHYHLPETRELSSTESWRRIRAFRRSVGGAASLPTQPQVAVLRDCGSLQICRTTCHHCMRAARPREVQLAPALAFKFSPGGAPLSPVV
jgi:hypothetical protein